MRLKKEGSCINIENEVDAWSRKTGAHASLFRKRRVSRVLHNLPEAHPNPKAWCPATKEQGLAGSEAPRLPGRRSTGAGPTDAGPSRRRQPNPVPEATQTPAGAHSPPAGGRKVRTGGAGMVSNPSAAVGLTTRAEPPTHLAVSPPTPRSRLGCNSKAGKSKKQGLPAGSPCFICICNPAAVQDSFCCF